MHSWGIKKVTFQHPQWLDSNIKSKTDNAWQSLLGLSYDTPLEMHKSYDFNDSYIVTLLQRKDTITNNRQNVDIKFFPDFSDTEIRMYYDNFGCMMLDSDDVCLTPWLNPMIQEDGEVKSCTGYSIGNINDSSFWELWNGERNQHFRKELMLHRKYSVCNRCCMMYQKTGDYGK